MKMRMNKGRVLVKLSDPDSLSDKLIIPDQAKKPSTKGKVISVANNLDAPEPGDNVLLKAYAGKEIEIEDEQFVIVDHRYILAVIED